MTYDIETYTLKYDIFLAESELFEELTSYKQLLTESDTAGLYILAEGVKETILNYIGKIIRGVQKVWDAIKERFSNMELPDNIYLKSIEKKIAEADFEPKFTIKNSKKYDDQKFAMVTVVPFDYQQMKPSLNSVENFIRTNYSNIVSGYQPQEGGFNVKEAIQQFIVSSEGDKRPTTDEMKEYYKWCTNNYKNSTQSVERDLKLINAITANVENYVKSTIASEAVSMLYYLTEADDDNDKMKVEDDPDKEKQDTEKSQFLKDLQVYMSFITQILTAKLEILRNRKKDYVTILKHYIPMVKKPKEEEQGEIEVNTQTVTKKVEI